MSEQVQHAAGPVTLVERTPEGPAIRNRAGIIAIFKPNPFPQHWLEEHPQALANARRGAALWNACEGIPTEALEAGVVQEMVEALEWFMQRSGLNDGEIDGLLIPPGDAAEIQRRFGAVLAKVKEQRGEVADG